LTNREGYPDFSFGRFGAYLARGIGPFLVALLFGLVMMLPVFIVEEVVRGFGLALIVPMIADQNSPGTAVAAALTITNILNVVYFVINTILYTIPLSLMIRGGLSNEIGESFKFPFIGEFFKRAGNDAFLGQAYLYLPLAGCVMVFALTPIWLLYLTILPAIGIYTLSYAWICCQLYRSYLTEKGPPFRVRCDVIEDA
jgi:hypothetical protein